jgi:hypothetical protein
MPVGTKFLQSIVSNPDKAIEKFRTHTSKNDGPTAFAWAQSLLLLAKQLFHEEDIRRRKRETIRLQSQKQEPIRSLGVSLDVLLSVFSYLSPQIAARVQRVSKTWQGVMTKHNVPWTIGPHGFSENCRRVQNRRGLDSRRVNGFGARLYSSGFVRNAVAFRFGLTPPTPLLMDCIAHMPQLRRIQMPTHLGTGSYLQGYFYTPQTCPVRLLSTHCAKITHMAVSRGPCITAVCLFPQLTSLLINFGISASLSCRSSHRSTEHEINSVLAVAAVMMRLRDIEKLSNLQHLGLHCNDLAGLFSPSIQTNDMVEWVADILGSRPNLVTLSFTGMFKFDQAQIRMLLDPRCNLRSLAVNVPDDDGQAWHIDDVLKTSPVSLLVLCLQGSSGKLPPRTLSKKLLWAMFVSGFEPLRARQIDIAGQKKYEAHPFRRVAADSIVWGLTGGDLFAE